MTEYSSWSGSAEVSDYLLVAWVLLVGYIIHARQPLWLYSLAVWSLVAYATYDEHSILITSFIIWFGGFTTGILFIFHLWMTDNDNAGATPRSGTLTLVNLLGEEKHYAAVTSGKPMGSVNLGHRPPLSWRRKPDDWNISLLVSKPGGVAPNVYFNVTPPNGKTGNIVVEALPHEGEKNICL